MAVAISDRARQAQTLPGHVTLSQRATFDSRGGSRCRAGQTIFFKDKSLQGQFRCLGRLGARGGSHHVMPLRYQTRHGGQQKACAEQCQCHFQHREAPVAVATTAALCSHRTIPFWISASTIALAPWMDDFAGELL